MNDQPNPDMPMKDRPGSTPLDPELMRPGQVPRATFIQFALGVIGSFLIGYFYGMLSPRDWFFPSEITILGDPVQDSILGGIVVTIDPVPATSVTKLELDGSFSQSETYNVKFDLSGSQLANQGKNLFIGVGWPAANGWPLDLGSSTNIYSGTITYQFGSLTASRKFRITHQGVDHTYDFSGSSDGSNVPTTIGLNERDEDEAAGTATILIRYKGYRDMIPIKVAAPGS